MLRNELFNLAGPFDNDPVVVDINGILVDVTFVTRDRDSVVLGLDSQELQAAMGQHAHEYP